MPQANLTKYAVEIQEFMREFTAKSKYLEEPLDVIQVLTGYLMSWGELSLMDAYQLATKIVEETKQHLLEDDN